MTAMNFFLIINTHENLCIYGITCQVMLTALVQIKFYIRVLN
jgi:hypothetical protein